MAFISLTVLMSDTSSSLFQQTHYLTNAWSLGGEILQALLDHPNERVIPLEVVMVAELSDHILSYTDCVAAVQCELPATHSSHLYN